MAGFDEARYEAIDPMATGLNAVRRAFENQAAYCRDNRAPITAAVCHGLLELLDSERGGTVMQRVHKWQGAPMADALPLRVAGGLHALHLGRHEPGLVPLYTGQRVSDVTALLADVLERREAFLLPWLDGPPQTNEAGRSWAFAAAMLWLVERGLPARLSLNELGSSAGINLMMGRYAYDLGGVRCGASDPAIVLAPEWRGEPPASEKYEIVSAQGCDVAPLNLTDAAQAARLKAYIWPEATQRFARMEAAIAAAHEARPEIEQMSAAEFVERVLDKPVERGVTRLIAHSVMWQYVAQGEQQRIKTLMSQAGANVSANAPLAWVSLESNRDTHRHELRVRYWPGGTDWTMLATAHPHGEWVEWNPSLRA